MGKIVEKTKKKKKGRPSLLDLQKRSLKQQEEQQTHTQIPNSNSKNSSVLHPSHNYNSATHTPSRRSTRRNPSHSSPGAKDRDSEPEEDDEAVQLNGKRREKKLKLVLKLPSSQKSELDSASLNSNGSDSNAEEDKTETSYHRKRKINAIGDGSGFEAEKSVSGANPTNIQDSGPSTPLPDKKLLLFILDRLQKKDTYGVFSEPVDPNELPDYHEVIEHPMDFGTVRKNLSSGVYTYLEQFEKDVFLICSNAMQYNAPDTIYFRQARSIHELAKKNFENLRQDSDDNEPEPKIVRRGRPTTKNIKKPVGRPSLEHAGSEFSLDATPATSGDKAIWSSYDMRKGPLVSEKSGFADVLGRSHARNDGYWLADNKNERNEEIAGSSFKGNAMKYGKKQFSLDENRRNTYNQSSAGGQEPSVLATFASERKQLMAVGLLSEYGYARSLAQFAANIGTVAWRIALKKIERSLPPGIKFGPGWVGENDILPRKVLLPSSPQGLPSPSQSKGLVATTSDVADSKEQTSEKIENNGNENEVPIVEPASKGHLSKSLSQSASASTSSVHGCSASMIRPRPPSQINQDHAVQPRINGPNGTYGFNLATRTGKPVGPAQPAGFSFQSSQTIDRISTTNPDCIHPATANTLNTEIQKHSDNCNPTNPRGATASSGNEELEAQESQPSQQGLPLYRKLDSGLSPQQKSDAVPPDLNIRFQSPGSPSSSRIDSAQPDLALQL